MTGSEKEVNLRAVLKTRLRGVIVIAGVGNTFRGDDGAGPRLVGMLREKPGWVAEPATSVHLINCRETPENYIGSIAQLHPNTVVIVDSTHLGLPPGEASIVEVEDLLEHNPSTHRMSPALFMNRLKEETEADVFMLAVQPATAALGESLSAPVTLALSKLAGLMESVIRPE